MLETQELSYQRNFLFFKPFSEQGSKIYALSRDHKPNDEMERKRIIEGGG